MKYLSVCSGIESASCAWNPIGWTPFAFSEIEPFPCAVLAHHYAETPNLGDMSKFKDWPYATIDLLVGGTPCQSFSVAGLRKGLDDPRGNLMLTYLAIAAKYRPKWLVWENVPGVLSSNGGNDFASLLRGLGECGYGFAYRILDAQYFGVAQRRRRVFVVGHLGDWRRAAAVLFERHSLQGNPAPSRSSREEVAGTISKCSFSGGAGGRPEGAAGNHFIASGIPDLARCDTTGEGKRQDYETCTIIPQAVSVSLRGRDGGATAELGDEVANCLRASGGGGDKAHALIPIGFDSRQDCVSSAELFGALGSSSPQSQAVAYGLDCEMGAHRMDGPTGPLMKGSPTGSGKPLPAITTAQAVRRLTPVECARLQGFADHYLDIDFNGKPAADIHKYKALGNSMAVPCMTWIGERIAEVDAIADIGAKVAA